MKDLRLNRRKLVNLVRSEIETLKSCNFILIYKFGNDHSDHIFSIKRLKEHMRAYIITDNTPRFYYKSYLLI